jgi:hypothetical protein
MKHIARPHEFENLFLFSLYLVRIKNMFLFDEVTVSNPNPKFVFSLQFPGAQCHSSVRIRHRLGEWVRTEVEVEVSRGRM